MRLETGVGSCEVLEVALELCCRCRRGCSLGTGGVKLGLELGAAGLQARGGCSVWKNRRCRGDAGLLQLAKEGFEDGKEDREESERGEERERR